VSKTGSVGVSLSDELSDSLDSVLNGDSGGEEVMGGILVNVLSDLGGVNSLMGESLSLSEGDVDVVLLGTMGKSNSLLLDETQTRVGVKTGVAAGVEGETLSGSLHQESVVISDQFEQKLS